MKTDRECNAAIQLCLVFYLGGKVMLYFYLVERLRAIRQTLMDRSADILVSIFSESPFLSRAVS